ncbi:MAG TPA: hypothetical protein IAA26_16010 [Candidatus Blautia faecipullorum]|nr:hypothetical protein [Candidatus Blautia faecipullorum]
MHMEKTVAEMSDTGEAKILNEQFMPYDLYLEEEEAGFNIDTRLNNLNNFYHWCASRVLSLDRKYAKQILNSIGAAQAVTDRDRAGISLSYHCVSLTDVFWVKKRGESVTFQQLNLYDNSLNEAVVEISLRGRQMTVTNRELAPDLSTKGCFPKAWIREEKGFHLLKDGDEDTVRRELLASRICQCFLSYDDLDGANCQTVLPERMTQREAAVEAVRKIGLRQVREIDLSIFGSMKKEGEMFCKRLSELKRHIL